MPLPVAWQGKGLPPGAVILPPSPGFYTHPASVDDIVDFVVARVLDQLHVPHSLVPRWGETGDETRSERA